MSCVGSNLCMRPAQWKTNLQCNFVSHWLGAHTKWSLLVHNSRILYIKLFANCSILGISYQSSTVIIPVDPKYHPITEYHTYVWQITHNIIINIWCHLTVIFRLIYYQWWVFLQDKHTFVRHSYDLQMWALLTHDVSLVKRLHCHIHNTQQNLKKLHSQIKLSFEIQKAAYTYDMVERGKPTQF